MSGVLIVGAQQDSLGARIRELLVQEEMVFTAGVSGQEDVVLDVNQTNDVERVLGGIEPDSIIVTAGINHPAAIGSRGYYTSASHSAFVNYLGVMNVLHFWLLRHHEKAERGQFVAISSNSAHIARRFSGPYCASKAALSMALRCAARELEGRPLVYGYEFGLLRGTPMTQATEARFGPAASRIPGSTEGLSTVDAARAVVRNFLEPWQGLNGVMLRLDGGEQ